VRYSVAVFVLLLAAVLEAGGDALIRSSLHAPSPARRWMFFVAGGIVLTTYGYAVNAPRWDFGRLLGVYVALFFVVAQAINWIAFDQKPTLSILVGGALILGGGMIVSLGR
jgi:drug/metabolite transporter superfamily protein YnfA